MDLETQKILAKAISGVGNNEPKPYDTIGEVVSISGETVYVRIQGSDISTPIVSSSVNVSVGDIVDLAVSHDDTHITGNRTDKAITKTKSDELAEGYSKCTKDELRGDIEDAGRTATNYMAFESGKGLIVGDMNSDELRGNTLIKSDGMSIRNGEEELASFGHNLIELGKNSEDTVIEMCNGVGKIFAGSYYDPPFRIQTLYLDGSGNDVQIINNANDYESPVIRVTTDRIVEYVMNSGVSISNYEVNIASGGAINLESLAGVHVSDLMIMENTVTSESGQINISNIQIDNNIIRTLDNNTLHLIGDNNLNLRAVNGVVRVRSGDNNRWAPISASKFDVQSSKRYKKNIHNMSEDMARQLLDYRVVTYDYKNEADGTNCMGLIAEEVAEVNEYAVTKDKKGRPDAIDYSRLVPQLIKMVQMQQKEIDELKEKLKED